jgi:pimeloyl-ACP methyl ester carboxylesterase
MVALRESPTESYIEPNPYAWLRTRAPVPTTYAPTCEPLYPFKEILENRTSRTRGMTGSCTELVEPKFAIRIEIWLVVEVGCTGHAYLHKYGFVHGNPIFGKDPSGEFLIAIDGTGTEDWLSNPNNPQRLSNRRWLSHVKNFADKYNGGASNKHYDYGPSDGTFASDMTAIESKAYKALMDYRSVNQSHRDEPVDLIGWSRGAYSVMRLAGMLADRNIKVRFLGLYDPVDMTYFDNLTALSVVPYRIPWNVQHTFVATGVNGDRGYRDYDEDSPLWFNWPRISVVAPHAESHAVTQSFVVNEYPATHGAIGGTPGYTPDPSMDHRYNYAHDKEQSIKVDTELRTAARNAGVPINVLSPSDYGFPPVRRMLPGNPLATTRTWANFLFYRLPGWFFQSGI